MFAVVPVQSPKAEVRYLDAKGSAVIHTLAYFSIFRHPLKQEELVECMHFCHAPIEDLSGTLSRLIEAKMIGSVEGFYFLAGQEKLVDVRIERNQRAGIWDKKIERSVRVLAHLPFVDAIALTGSMSKGTQDPDGDIDFIVLTRPGRMWTSYFFFAAMLRLVSKSTKKLLCANMMMAADRLSVRGKNLYTASEVVTLRPLTNTSLWQDFYRENAWAAHFYPEWVPAQKAEHEKLVTHRIRELMDRVLSGRLGDWFEGAFADRITRHMRRNEKAKNGNDPLQRRWLDSVEIGHSQHRQRKWQLAWNAALEEFQKRHSVRMVRWQWELGNRAHELGAIKFGRGPSQSWFPQLSSSAPWRRGPLPSGD